MKKKFRVKLVTPSGEIAVSAAEDEHIWDAAVKAGHRLPASCLQGWCLTCAGRLISGNFNNEDALRYFPADREHGFVLLCTAKPCSDLEILTHQKQACQEHRKKMGLPAPRG